MYDAPFPGPQILVKNIRILVLGQRTKSRGPEDHQQSWPQIEPNRFRTGCVIDFSEDGHALGLDRGFEPLGRFVNGTRIIAWSKRDVMPL
jgi:hypothetical protein